MHEMFGIANLKMMSHLALCTRKGHLVDATGEDVYLPNLERLNLPITFVHGELNKVWLPEATEATYDLLRKNFDPDQYERVVIPRYGHLDPVFGKDALADCYGFFLEHLKRVGA